MSGRPDAAGAGAGLGAGVGAGRGGGDAAEGRLAEGVHAAAERAGQGDLAGARRLLEGLLVEWGDRYEVLANYGLILHLAGHGAQAVTYLRRALELNPADPTLMHSLGLCLTGMNLWPEALEIFGANWEGSGDRYWTALMCGVSLSMMSEVEEAIGWYTEAHRASATAGRAASAYLLGYALCLRERWEEALPYLREAERGEGGAGDGAGARADEQLVRLLALAADPAARTGAEDPLAGWDPLPDRWLRDAGPAAGSEPPCCG
ncbi:MAG: tetratricopeptide repeat protein [Planctomycetes bacterium]|nr:tetratricopeptide repeat protein [Planctomycetota bacterium]